MKNTDSLFQTRPCVLRRQGMAASGMLVVLLAAGIAFAQAPVPKAKAPAAKKKGAGGCSSPSDARPLPIDPSAKDSPKWECKQTIIEQKPVWVGKMLKCDFEVSNAGKADLQLKIGKS